VDPVATILATLAGDMPRQEARRILAEWYGKGGFRPTLAAIAAQAERRADQLPARWQNSARLLGAVS
jgi:hypothetical protein